MTASEGTSMYCPHCGTEVSSDFSFCPKCGKKISEQLSVHKAPESETRTASFELITCPTCGFQNAAGAKSCESCGTFLKSAIGSQQPESEVHKSKAQLFSDESKSKGKEADGQKGTKSRKASSKSNLLVNKQTQKFRLQSYQVVSIIAALLLGGILVYGLMSSKPTATTQDSSGGTQQSQGIASGQASNGQPGADVLQEIDRLRQVVDKNPDDLVSTLRLSNMLQDNGMYDQAVIYYKRYLNKMPANVDAQVDYGVTLYEGGHTQDAIEQLTQVIKADPKHQKAYFNLGIVYLNAGDINKSNDALKKCVQIDRQSDVGKQAEQILEQHANIKN